LLKSTVQWINEDTSLSLAFLHAYLANEDEQLLRRLLEKGASGNYAIRESNPLRIAIQRKDINTARLLVHNDAVINLLLFGGHTPLTLAAKKSLLEFVDLFLKAGSNVSSVTEKSTQI